MTWHSLSWETSQNFLLWVSMSRLIWQQSLCQTLPMLLHSDGQTLKLSNNKHNTFEWREMLILEIDITNLPFKFSLCLSVTVLTGSAVADLSSSSSLQRLQWPTVQVRFNLQSSLHSPLQLFSSTDPFADSEGSCLYCIHHSGLLHFRWPLEWVTQTGAPFAKISCCPLEQV